MSWEFSPLTVTIKIHIVRFQFDPNQYLYIIFSWFASNNENPVYFLYEKWYTGTAAHPLKNKHPKSGEPS